MEEVRLEWTVRLYQNWRKTLVLVLVIILVCALVYLSFREILFVILAAIFLCGSVINFFFPIKYVFTDESIKVITPLTSKKRNWSTLKSYYIDKNGVFLSPFTGKSRLERFRGLYLIGARHNTEAIAFVREKLKPQEKTKA